ncbi:MAG: hypothetical protein LBQ09_00265 [Acidobacteriaceae bacterium]|jgi:hypothetical protein|nr:hypothetical protein [Acidobacteriaceae bacterium]
MRHRLFGLVVVAGLALAGYSPAVVAQQAAPSGAAAKLPPLLYTCPMDTDVLEEKPGACPICKMDLVPIRIDAKWWCPTHTKLEVHDGPGKCRRDGKDLIPVTLSISWTCPGSDNKLLDPGKCPDGSARRIDYELRAHGDHNPRHGGQFFMAEDQWHHIEGTYPSAGLFRVYFYDNFTKPLNAKEFSGAFVILDQAYKEIASFPLALAGDGTTMEAKIPANYAGLPLNGGARITFGAGKKPQLFNFTFPAYSKDPAAPASKVGRLEPSRVPFAASIAPTTGGFSFRQLARADAEPAVAATQDPATQSSSGSQATPAPLVLDSPLNISQELAAATDEARLPQAVPDLINVLTERFEEIQKLIAEGALGQAWLPAMGTKTVALVLDSKSASLPAAQREAVSAAAKRIITAAWEIDAYGDLGNGKKIIEAFGRLSSAVADLKGAYGTSR